MFQGSHSVTIDAKGRFAIPTSCRQSLIDDCGGRLVVTQYWDGCLFVYPQPEFQTFREKLLASGGLDPVTREYQRFLIGAAQTVDMDRQGRVLVTSELREFAGLNSKGMLVGMGPLFELWDEQTWITRNANTAERLAAQAANGELPEALMNISL